MLMSACFPASSTDSPSPPHPHYLPTIPLREAGATGMLGTRVLGTTWQIPNCLCHTFHPPNTGSKKTALPLGGTASYFWP